MSVMTQVRTGGGGREAIARRLIKGSVKRSYAPVVDLDWEREPEPDRYFLPPSVLSLVGTDLWEQMDEAQRIELSAQFTEVERPREKFSYSYLPESIETLFREALSCYSAGAFNAFASMCRRTLQAAFAESGEAGRMRVFDLLNDVRTMVDLDADTFIDIKRVVFGTDADPHPSLPLLEEQQAGVLLEVMKDLLYQLYVRKGRLQQAMMVRRFFSEESLRDIAARG